MALLRKKRQIKVSDGVMLRWTPGQYSALDTREISEGRDVGNVTATSRTRRTRRYALFRRLRLRLSRLLPGQENPRGIATFRVRGRKLLFKGFYNALAHRLGIGEKHHRVIAIE